LLARGALRVKPGEYASLELVDSEARPILRGETQVMLHEEPPVADAPRSRRGPGARPAAFAEPAAGGDALFDALRAWRMQIAKAQGVPPYVIFHDAVLRDIAAVRPGTRDALAEIKGVGASKLDRYADAVLGVVAKGQ
jgi:ATP-dependent DNA helicase RecQ